MLAALVLAATLNGPPEVLSVPQRVLKRDGIVYLVADVSEGTTFVGIERPNFGGIYNTAYFCKYVAPRDEEIPPFLRCTIGIFYLPGLQDMDPLAVSRYTMRAWRSGESSEPVEEANIRCVPVPPGSLAPGTGCPCRIYQSEPGVPCEYP